MQDKNAHQGGNAESERVQLHSNFLTAKRSHRMGRATIWRRPAWLCLCEGDLTLTTIQWGTYESMWPVILFVGQQVPAHMAVACCAVPADGAQSYGVCDDSMANGDGPGDIAELVRLPLRVCPEPA